MSPVTDPFLPDTPTFTGQSLAHVAAARVMTAADVLVTTLDLERAQLSFDETRAPRVRAALTGRVPTDQAILDAIDPRTGARVELDAGYVRPGGQRDVHTIADLILRSRRVTRPANLVELDAASDESIVIDNAAVDAGAFTGDAIGLIQTNVNACFTTGRTFTTLISGGYPVAVDSISDRWTAINDTADQVGARVYDDGLRRWFIVPSADTTDAAAAQLSVGGNGTIETSDTALARDDWFNQVFMDYRWTDPSNVDHRERALVKATGGPLGVGVGNVKTYYERRETPATHAQAVAAGSSVLRRLMSRGRSFQIRAGSLYWLRPGMSVTVQLPTGNQERHLVQAVTFDLIAGWMDVTTRLPDNTFTTGE